MIKKFKNQKGFTILESIVAILILSLSIAGVFSAVQQSLLQASTSKNEIKAFYLAQEAVEIIRNIRDNNQLTKLKNGLANNWLDGITDPLNCPFGKVCRADITSNSLVLCGDAWDTTCPVLKQDPNTFLYNYNTGNDTSFKREIQLESINTNEISVVVKISWTEGSTQVSFKVKTLLFNWAR
jgi:prepilin-type N-terminal cleavage/methylation domain-containing protein